MAVFVVVGFWLTSLVVTALVFWLAAKRSLAPAPECTDSLEVIAPSSERLPVAGLPSRGSQKVPPSSGEPVSGSLLKSLRFPKARAHVFNEMPPVETVRAQADVIREQERLWEDREVLADLPELLCERQNYRRRAIAPKSGATVRPQERQAVSVDDDNTHELQSTEQLETAPSIKLPKSGVSTSNGRPYQRSFSSTLV